MTTDPQTARPEVDDPRVLALANARQQMAYKNPFNVVCPPWDGLTDQEQHLSLLDARNYLRAAIDAGLVAAVPSAPAELANLRAMYDAVSAREHELIEERDKLVRWHGEDEAAHKEMRATIERLRTEKRELGELAARRESELIYYRYRKTAAKTPAGRAPLRDRIAEALIEWTYRGKNPEHGGILETVRANAYSRADAVLAVLPPVDRGAVLREAADDLATAFGDPMAKHIGHLGAAHLRRRAREVESGQTTETQPETPLEKRLRYSERRNDELRAECKRRGKRVLEQSETIRALKREVDEARRQLGAEILRAGQAEAELRRMADEAQPTRDCPTPETHNWGCGCPSDVAAAIASCPGREMGPSTCRCPCYGCKHHCAAHDPDDPRCDMAAEEPISGTQQCGHDDYHDPHQWHERPDVWCPGIGYDEPAVVESGKEA